MDRSRDKQSAECSSPNAEVLKRRLEAIAEGLKEGIRREIARREKFGLPIYVADNGTVVNRQTTPTGANDATP